MQCWRALVNLLYTGIRYIASCILYLSIMHICIHWSLITNETNEKGLYMSNICFYWKRPSRERCDWLQYTGVIRPPIWWSCGKIEVCSFIISVAHKIPILIICFPQQNTINENGEKKNQHKLANGNITHVCGVQCKYWQSQANYI